MVFLASIIVITPGPNILSNYKNNKYFGIFVHQTFEKVRMFKYIGIAWLSSIYIIKCYLSVVNWDIMLAGCSLKKRCWRVKAYLIIPFRCTLWTYSFINPNCSTFINGIKIIFFIFKKLWFLIVFALRKYCFCNKRWKITIFYKNMM